MPIYVFCIFNSCVLINFISGSAFEEASLALVIFAAFAGTQTALGNNFTVSTLYVIHKRNDAIRTTIEGSVLNIGLNFLLIPVFGMLGAITATGITMVYMVLRQLIIISNNMKIAPVFPVIGKCFLYCLIASIPPLIFTLIHSGNLITNLLLYLTTLVAILLWTKTLSDLGLLMNQPFSLKKLFR